MRRAYSVLVCEDEYLLALEVAQDLQASGCHVAGIISRVEQIEDFLRSKPPDCVILDLDLFGVSAESQIELILGRGIGLVIYTGYADFRPPVDAIPVVVKPAADGQLAQALEQAMAVTARLSEFK